jgi:hypothetical protein
MQPVYVQRDTYAMPRRPRVVEPRRIPLPGAMQHNLAVLSNQVRVSSGFTLCAGGVLRTVSAASQRLVAVEPQTDRLPLPGDYAPPASVLGTNAGRFYCGLLALADRAEPLPVNKDLAAFVGMQGEHTTVANNVASAYRKLERLGLLHLANDADGFRTVCIVATEQVLVSNSIRNAW